MIKSIKNKNIMGTELQKCNNYYISNDSSINGYCNEIGNGYHNICVKMNPYVSNNFSNITGQSDWSKNRLNNNHCVCQGAWANYVANHKKKNKEIPYGILNCEAIHEDVLTKYDDKFKTWNNVTIEGQYNDGINEIRRQCNI